MRGSAAESRDTDTRLLVASLSTLILYAVLTEDWRYGVSRTKASGSPLRGHARRGRHDHWPGKRFYRGDRSSLAGRARAPRFAGYRRADVPGHCSIGQFTWHTIDHSGGTRTAGPGH